MMTFINTLKKQLATAIMKLPNRENAMIEPNKLIDYLLNPYHKRGGIKENYYGTRYEITAELLTPVDQKLLVKTVWQIAQETNFPRLITLFPD